MRSAAYFETPAPMSSPFQYDDANKGDGQLAFIALPSALLVSRDVDTAGIDGLVVKMRELHKEGQASRRIVSALPSFPDPFRAGIWDPCFAQGRSR